MKRRWLLVGAAAWACSPREKAPRPERRATTSEPAPSSAAAPPSGARAESTASAALGPEAPPSATPTASGGEATASVEVAAPRKKESRHHLTVPAAHVEAGAGRSYTVHGDGHSHPISIDEGAMARLKSAGFALVQCGLGGPDKPHRHWVVVHVG